MNPDRDPLGGLGITMVMSISEKIGAHIRRSKVSDPTLHISDFQVRVDKAGAVVINLRTGEAELLLDRFAEPVPTCESITQ